LLVAGYWFESRGSKKSDEKQVASNERRATSNQ
jgi:hypothetical protein